ncbi:MAG: hypothetical protein ACRDG7_19645 [Candidatus Limnocylindria bacterium]
MTCGSLDGSDRPARDVVLRALDSALVVLTNPDQPGRYVLVAKVDDDSLSERRASYHRDELAARRAITAVPQGWWPDCLIDLEAPVALAVRDAAGADGILGPPYPFDEDHVIFA